MAIHLPYSINLITWDFLRNDYVVNLQVGYIYIYIMEIIRILYSFHTLRLMLYIYLFSFDRASCIDYIQYIKQSYVTYMYNNFSWLPFCILFSSFLDWMLILCDMDCCCVNWPEERERERKREEREKIERKRDWERKREWEKERENERTKERMRERKRKKNSKRERKREGCHFCGFHFVHSD